MSGMNSLTILLYCLLFERDADSIEAFDYEKWAHFDNTYESEERAIILEDLNWAVENPDHDFQSMLPEISLENDEIYKFLCEMLASHHDYVAERDSVSK